MDDNLLLHAGGGFIKSTSWQSALQLGPDDWRFQADVGKQDGHPPPDVSSVADHAMSSPGVWRQGVDDAIAGILYRSWFLAPAGLCSTNQELS